MLGKGKTMSEISFLCPHCEQSLGAPSEMADEAITCPSCNKRLRVPSPALQKKLPSERRLWSGRTSHIYYRDGLILGTLLIPVYGFGLLLLIPALMKRYSRYYVVTDRRITVTCGVFSRTVKEVRIRDIRYVGMKQGVWQRLYKIGTLEIGTSATAGIEISIVGINDPAKVHNLIRQSMDA